MNFEYKELIKYLLRLCLFLCDIKYLSVTNTFYLPIIIATQTFIYVLTVIKNSSHLNYYQYYIWIITSITHHMLNTRCELLARDSAYNFSFSCIKRGFVEFQNKRQFQTQSHGNLRFHSSKMIFFFLFGNYYEFDNYDTI